ncbi:Cytochrome b-c1 complex subunit 2, mitochondrial [Zancudomyces culisetae]|uniref:Cytochrome b-c1 complex subunit 2, mitochondrial n=1 Tax=Zancudomyces culisetae TaxID=1213189 RepID=A0A1R1PE70_ZANCU|nr:Cytochrome b-c1 complex subunit 2, mitochondrial [Zancudomyces culisetae]|eukprot:OMH79295.1 Cytochrome b-c1 complex subunit 2, mitochondrial [Zancudomyces culisetae]
MFRNTVKIGSSVRKYATTSGSVVSKLSNGIKVAAADLNKEGSMGSISIVVKAGSRFEDANSAGAAHFFKAFGFRDSEKRTSFRKVREAELQGANLSAQVTRENVIFTVECLKVDM